MGAPGLTLVTLGLFSTSLVTRVARDTGRFAEHGLDVVEDPVPSSPEQFRALLRGEYDLVLTSPDNVLAYRLDPDNPLKAVHDVRIVAALDRGLGISLIGAPGVHTLDDLRGQDVAVDVPGSGFAFALYRVLAAGGLERDRDYRVVTAGATPRRRSGLLAGSFAATLLGAGHDVSAVTAGCHRIVRVTDVVRPFLGTVLAATGPWLAANPDVATRFLAAWRATAAQIVDPMRRAGTLAAVTAHIGLPGTDAVSYYRTLVSPTEGLIADGDVDLAALAVVARLRADHTNNHVTLHRPADNHTASNHPAGNNTASNHPAERAAGSPSAAAGPPTDPAALVATGIVDDRLLRATADEAAWPADA